MNCANLPPKINLVMYSTGLRPAGISHHSPSKTSEPGDALPPLLLCRFRSSAWSWSFKIHHMGLLTRSNTSSSSAGMEPVTAVLRRRRRRRRCGRQLRLVLGCVAFTSDRDNPGCLKTEKQQCVLHS